MPPKKEKEFSIVSWYNGNMVSAANVSIQNVLHFTDDELENKHDFIQLLFPLPWASQVTNSTVVATKRNYSTIRGSAQAGRNFRTTMLTALKRILAMFDLELTPTKESAAPGTGLPYSRHRNRGRRIRRITPHEGDGIDHAAREARLQALASRNNHHHRRITRIIRSLRLCGRIDDAESVYRFFRRFGREHRSITLRTLRMWGVAANSAYVMKDPREDIKDTEKGVMDGEPSDGESESDETTTTDGDGGTNDTIDTSSDEGGESGEGGGTGSEKPSDDGSDDGGGGFGPVGGDTPPPPPTGGRGPDEGRPPKIGDPRMTDEDLQKLTDSDRALHHARIKHRHENRDIEIGLNLRNADGKWIGKDEDPMTMVLIELRVWQLILRDLEEERLAAEVAQRRIEEGEEPDDASSDSNISEGSNYDTSFTREDIEYFGDTYMSVPDYNRLETWERNLHIAQCDHYKDYNVIEIRHRFRDSDGNWRDAGTEPINMSRQGLKAWQSELDKREADRLDAVMRGERRMSEDVESDVDPESEYDYGDPGMSERYFNWLGDEDKERHLAFLKYNEKYKSLEYELGFRDRTTFEWISVTMDPNDMNLTELDQWEIEIERMGDAWMDNKEREDEEAVEAAHFEAMAKEVAAERAEQLRLRQRSPESIEMEKMMAERVKMGLDPIGDFPEAKRWKTMMEEMEAAKAEAERLEQVAKAEAKRTEEEESSDEPGKQLRAEAEGARNKQNAGRTSQEREDSSRSKRRRIG
ncbi:hypothetical protein V493_02813 [Pseudogymnoascus sp. VKM F-4281 (FW-2241)]|nr:hypothetical protein V493_02813 [Pseudogymnoascus sp. VKM F-4281 (FW-2241)]